MSDLPESWTLTLLSTVLHSLRDGTHTPPQRTSHGVPLLSARNIKNGAIDWNEPYSHISAQNYLQIQRTNPVSEGDVLLTIVGSIGRSCVNRTNDRFTLQRSVAIAKPNLDVIDGDYLSFLFRSHQFQAELEEQASGTAQRGIYLGTLKTIPIILAPLNEQRRIVAKLQKLLIRVHAAQERLATIPRILKRFRQSVLSAACSGQLTVDWRESNVECEPATILLARIAKRRALWLEQQSNANNSEAQRLKRKLQHHSFEASTNNGLPEGWAWSSLLHSCWLVVDCHNKTAPYTPSGVPLIRTTNIKSGRLVLNELKYVSKDTYDYWSRRCPPQANDILFTREAPMGESAIIPAGFQLCMGQRLMLFRVFADLTNVKYLSYALQEPLFQSRLEGNSVGSGVKHLRVGDVESLIVPIPPLAEQQEIVRRVDALFKTADVLEARYQKAKAHIDKLSQSILAKAFRGELVPQDPNDEPASALVERIREERNGSPVRKRRTRK